MAVHPLTRERWPDLVDLFGPQRGACAGCWCMWPRLSRPRRTALWRDAKLYEIGAGTSEIRRMLIGRELFAKSM